MGVVPLEKALQIAKERNLDLIQVTDKTDPPVCKIQDYGKYLYQFQKKEKAKIKKSSETKGIRLRFNISSHDIETRILQAEKFLKKGNKVRIDMILRGREKRLSGFAKEKMSQFIEDLGKKIPIKTEGQLKRKPRGFSITISKTSEQ